MLDYIWINDQSSIVRQLPSGFQAAAILFHPFVQMPVGHGDHKYPSNEELIQAGQPISWEQVMAESGLRTREELAYALLTSICALKKEYARLDLSERLNANMKPYRGYPTEDCTSVCDACIFLRTHLREKREGGNRGPNTFGSE